MVAVLMSFVPHFDLPFRFLSTGHAATVDQDTLDDVSNCVEAIMRTLQGERNDNPSFGIPDPTFQLQPIDVGLIIEAVLQQEPRASLVMEQDPDQFNQLVADVVARVSIAQGVSNG
jgi:phage baseplate assembly protein W